MRIVMGLTALAAALLFGSVALAQTITQPTTPTDARLDHFEQRLDEMERRHQAELKTRDEEIARLRAELDRQRPGTAPPSPASGAASQSAGTGDALGEIESIGKTSTGPSHDQIENTKQQVLRDIDSNRSSPLTLRNPVSFNPDLAVVSDFLGSLSTHRDNNALNRFDVREVELDLRAAVDPRADGVAILSFSRDVDNPIFPGSNTFADQGGPDTNLDVEEAYLFLHDFGIPNLTAKLGRFHVRFGRENILHLHDLPTSDPPFVNQAFLAPEALTDSGLSLSYVIPPPLVGGQYIEIDEEILAGEGAGAESPTLSGDLSVDSPAFNTHVLWNTDIASDWNLELGGSWLHGKRSADNDEQVDLFGLDCTLIHTDPHGGFFNQLIQAELDYGAVDQPNASTQHALGAYLLAQQQLNRDVYAGVRLDWAQDPNNDNRELWGVSPYVSWYWSEFLRFRVEYQHKEGDVPSENNLFFQATWIFGAHPPHPYWAMKG